MGNFEKLVVLIVLFLSAVVLAVSLSDGEADAGAGPLTTSLDVEETAERAAVPAPADGEVSSPRERERETTPVQVPYQAKPAPALEEPESEKPSLLLDAGPSVTPAAAGAIGPNGMRRILRDTAGLRRSMSDLYMEYVVEEGETWAGLAQRFYRDTRQVSALQVANEDLARLTAGQVILVPVYDLAQESGTRARLQPLRRDTPVAADEASARITPSVTPGVATRPPSVGEGDTYIVVDGDNLSKISLKVYATANRWQEIYEANKDVMKSADWLTIGMKLYIPRAGEVVVPPAPAAAATTETATDGRPRVR